MVKEALKKEFGVEGMIGYRRNLGVQGAREEGEAEATGLGKSSAVEAEAEA